MYKLEQEDFFFMQPGVKIKVKRTKQAKYFTCYWAYLIKKFAKDLKPACTLDYNCKS